MEKKKNHKYKFLNKQKNYELQPLLFQNNCLKKACLSSRLLSSKSNNLNNNTRLTNDTSYNNDENNKFRQCSKKKIREDILLMNQKNFNSEKIKKKYRTIISPKVRKKLKYINNE